MNVSRLAVLAVFFMMVMSAFVAVPAYNVSAEDHGEDEDHDHDEDNGDHRKMKLRKMTQSLHVIMS